MIKISVVIPVFNKINIIKTCILYNIDHADAICEWIIIDNNSDIETKSGLIQIKNYAESKGHTVNLITETTNTGVAVAWNKGLSLSNAPYICILNNDCVMMAGWCSALIHAGEKQNLDLYSPWVLESWMFKGKYDLSDFLKGKLNWESLLLKNKAKKRNGLFGGVVLFGKSIIFDKIGSFDEKFWLSLEEMDYELRAQKLELNVASTGNVMAFHLGGITRNTMNTDGGTINQNYFLEKWGWHFEKQEHLFINRIIKSIQKKYWQTFYKIININFQHP